MSQPFLSGVCVTFGRVAWLQEAIQLYLNQDYTGPRELIVYNTCPVQRLSCEAEGVRVINCEVRPGSLGEARNTAIAAARGTHILTIDDDDVILAHHFRTYAENFGEHDWIWLDKEFYAEGEEIRGIVQGACPLFAFTKKAWEGVTGYADMGVGEDRNFISRVTEKYQGRKVEITGLPTFVYRWGQGTFHFSGKGEVPSAHKDIEADLLARIQKGREPVGDIRLVPQVKLDWRAKAEGFIEQEAKRLSKKKQGDDVAIMLLGRFGDIINALPIAQHIAQNYGKPHWIVSREFASVFEGVSYVEPYVVDVKNHQIREGLALAQKQFRHVICAQIWGKDWVQDRQCESYNRESWRVAGFGNRFDSRHWKPLFDRRDFVREQAFYRKTNPEGRPMLIVNVRRSVSSPFRRGDELQHIIACAFPQLLLVDVADWDLPHIYDLLGLMERAVAVVSIDTALLHLAAACDVPIVALVNPMAWQGSEIRGNEALRLPYDKITLCPNLIVEAIDEALENHKPDPRLIMECAPMCPPVRQIYHCVERHDETNPVEKKRKALAWRSWDELYARGEMVPAHLWEYPRNTLSIGESRALPYVKDVIAAGLKLASDQDIVIFTNDDNVLHPQLPTLLRYWVSLYDCCCSSRCEFQDANIPNLGNKPEVFATNGRQHMGRDLFAATKRWWVHNWDQIPDFIIGASDFDLCLCAMFRLQFNIRTNRHNLDFEIFPADLPRGYIIHQWHPPKWADPKNVDVAPSQIHNRSLFRAWAGIHLPELYFYPNGTI